LSISHDLTNIGKTHIKGNRSPISIDNTSAVIGSTDIIGPGILATNSNVKIQPFTRILSDAGFSKSPTEVKDGTEKNKFAILAINSNISSPDMGITAGSLGISAQDPVTGIQVPKFQGSGRVQGINSKIVMNISKTNFSTVVDTIETVDTIKGDTTQIVLP
jgi:hypothetical protein